MGKKSFIILGVFPAIVGPAGQPISNRIRHQIDAGNKQEAAIDFRNLGLIETQPGVFLNPAHASVIVVHTPEEAQKEAQDLAKQLSEHKRVQEAAGKEAGLDTEKDKAPPAQDEEKETIPVPQRGVELKEVPTKKQEG